MADLVQLAPGETDLGKIVAAIRALIDRFPASEDAAAAATPTSTQIISGAGLTGGGDLSTDRTLAVGAGTGITVNADDVALANMAQATIKGRAAGAGTGAPTDLTGTQATAILDAFTSSLKGLVPASGGGTTNFLRADATFASTIIAGMVRQVLQTTYATNADLTNAIPLDDTTPLSSEGTTIFSQAITPADNNNKVLVRVVINGSQSNNNTAMIVALFRGTTCIDAKVHTFPTSNFPAVLSMEVLDSPATSSSVTYTVNVGPSANTLRLNGSTIARYFGGAAVCTLTLEEIEA